jgi:hypothetical protein
MSKMRVVQVTRPKGALELVEREIPEPGVGSSVTGYARLQRAHRCAGDD